MKKILFIVPILAIVLCGCHRDQSFSERMQNAIWSEDATFVIYKADMSPDITVTMQTLDTCYVTVWGYERGTEDDLAIYIQRTNGTKPIYYINEWLIGTSVSNTELDSIPEQSRHTFDFSADNISIIDGESASNRMQKHIQYLLENAPEKVTIIDDNELHTITNDGRIDPF